MARVGTVEQMLDEEKYGVKVFTIDGLCSNCGNCCANFLPISKGDIERIRRYIKKHGVKEQLRRWPTSAPLVDMMCPFRDELGKRCTIYPVRPAVCRAFRCDKPEMELLSDKAFYHGKFSEVDMRGVFFGREVLKLSVGESDA